MLKHNDLLVCDVCGIDSTKKRVRYRQDYNMCLCDKHIAQLKTKGKITDPSPRGCFDKNDYEVKDGIVYMNLYNRQQKIIGVTMFDEKFLNYLKNFVWRPVLKSHEKWYAATIGRPESGLSHEYMHRIIMELEGIDMGKYEVDHINGNSLDNRTSNLRLLTGQDQKLNMKPKYNGKIPVRGVSYNKTDNNYVVDFRIRNDRYYLKHWDSVEEAVYARYILERELCGDLSLVQSYQFMEPYIKKLDDSKKQEIETYVLHKIETHQRGETVA